MITEVELLKKVCEAADMGRDSINQVRNLTENKSLNSALQAQCREYDKIYHEAERLLLEQGQEPKNSSPFAKVNSRLQVNLQTKMAANEISKIAEMIIKGSTMGVTKVTQQLHAYEGNDQEAKRVAEKLLKTEEANIQEMQKFL